MKKYLNSKSIFFKLIFLVFFAIYLVAVITSANVDAKKVLGIIVNNFDSSRRIVIKLNNLTPYRLNKEKSLVTVELINAKKDLVTVPQLKNDSIIKNIQFKENPNNVFRIEIDLASANCKVSHFPINNPSLIIIDIDRIISQGQNLGALPTDEQNRQSALSDVLPTLLEKQNIFVISQNLPALNQIIYKDLTKSIEENVQYLPVPYKFPYRFPTPEIAQPPMLKDDYIVYSSKTTSGQNIIAALPPTAVASVPAAQEMQQEMQGTAERKSQNELPPTTVPGIPSPIAKESIEPKSDIFIGFQSPKDKKVVSYKDIELMDEFPVEFLKVPEDNLKFIYTEFLRKDYLSCSQDILNYLVDHLNTPQLEDLLFMEAECKYHLLRIAKSNNFQPVINNLRLALRKFPDTDYEPYAYLRMAQSYFNMEWYQEAAAVVDVSNSLLASEFDMQLLYLKGEASFRCKSYEIASNSLEKLVTDFPKNPNIIESYYRLGEINFIKEKYLIAYDYFSKGEKLSSDYALDNPDLLFKIAKAAFINENYKKAREIFAVLIKSFPSSPYAFDAMELMGDSYLAQNDRKNTLAAYSKFIEKSSDKIKTLAAQIHLAELGIEDSQKNRLNRNVKTEAYLYPVDTLKNIMMNYPDNELAQVAGFKLGAYYAKQKQVQESVRLFNYLLKKYPDSKIRVNIEDFLRVQFSSAFQKSYKNGNYLDCIQLFKDNELYLVESNLGNKIFFYLGDSYYNLHLYDKAVRLFEKVIESYNPIKDSEVPIEDIYYKTAEIYSRGNDPKKSIYVCELLRQKFPASRLFDKATLLLCSDIIKLGKYAPTITVLAPLKDSLTLNNDEKLNVMILTAECYKNLGNVKMTIETYRDAISFFEKLNENYVSSPFAKQILFSLADTLYQNKKYDKAIVVLKQIAEVYPKDKELPQVYYKIGKSEFELKNMDSAKGYLEKARQVTAANSLIDQLSNDTLQEIDWRAKNRTLFE